MEAEPAQSSEHRFDRLSSGARILEMRRHLAEGKITQDFFTECCAALLQRG